MKYFTIPILILFSPLLFNAQTIDVINQNTIGGGLNDNLQTFTTQNGFVIGGTSLSGASGDKTESSFGGSDFWLLEIDNNLNINWQVAFGGDSSDDLKAILPTSDGGYILAGNSNSGISGNKTVGTNGGFDFWVIKVDENGVEEWQENFGGSGSEVLADLQMLPNGDIILLGNSDSSTSGDISSSTYGSNDYWLLKIDDTGAIIWETLLGGNDSDLASKVFIHGNNIYIGGHSLSNTSGVKTEDNYGTLNNWILKLDINGSVLWDKTIGGDNIDFLNDFKIYNNVIYNLSTSSSNSAGTKTENSRGGRDYWITKLDTNGIILSDVTIGGSGDDEGRSLVFDGYGEMIILGDSESGISGDKTIPNYMNSQDFWLVAIDTSSLALSWQKVLGGNQHEYSSKLHFGNSNNLYVFGRSNSDISGDKTEVSQGGDDFWIVELSTDLKTDEFESLDRLVVYPNPTSDRIKFKGVQENNDYTVSVINQLGQVVLKKPMSIMNNQLNIQDLTPGSYTLQLKDGNTIKHSTLIIR